MIFKEYTKVLIPILEKEAKKNDKFGELSKKLLKEFNTSSDKQKNDIKLLRKIEIAAISLEITLKATKFASCNFCTETLDNNFKNELMNALKERKINISHDADDKCLSIVVNSTTSAPKGVVHQLHR